MSCHVSGGVEWRDGSEGDTDNVTVFDTILVYNPETEGWRSAGNMRERRWSHAVTVVEIEKVVPYCQEKSGSGAMKVSSALVMSISLSIIWRQ